MITVNCKQLPDTQIYWEMADDAEFNINTNQYGENHTSEKFTQLCHSLNEKRPFSVLELGCGGGGVIDDFIRHGHIGVGLDARAGYELRKAFGWGSRPNNFFRCDLSSPFQIYFDGEPAQFDFILSFEFMEHIHREGIDTLMENMKNHSHDSTIMLHQISNKADNTWDMKVHRTIEKREWWLHKFNSIDYKDHGEFTDSPRKDCDEISMKFLLKKT